MFLPLAAQGQERQASVDLLELTAREGGPQPGPALRLSPEWIGTIVGEEGTKALDLRLSHAGYEPPRRWPDGNRAEGTIWAGRMTEGDKVKVLRDRVNYYKSLPAVAEIKATKDLLQLRTWLGPQRGLTDVAADDEGRIHWTESWTCLTRAEDGKLRWLEVIALASGKDEDRRDPQLARIDGIKIREGILRPADPNSDEELKLYKTANQIRDEENAAMEAQRTALPQPLRDLVAARDARLYSGPDQYLAALAAIRKNPKPELFQQLAAIEENDIRFFYLEDILLDGPLKPEPWTDEPRRKAMRYAAKALEKSHDPAKLQKQVVTLLHALGGGQVVIERPAINLTLKLEVGGSGTELLEKDWDVTEQNLGEAGQALGAWFEQRL